MNIVSKDTWQGLTRTERREFMVHLEQTSREQEQVEVPIREYFSEGLYAREMTLAAGTLFVGEIHLHENMCSISKGVIDIATEDGMETLTAPCTFVAPAGTKRIGNALTDVVWTVFHPTTLTNTDDIRKAFIAENYESYDKQLEHNHELDSDSNRCIRSE